MGKKTAASTKSTAATTKAAAKPAASPADVLTMPLAQLASAVSKANALLAQFDQTLPGLVELTAAARAHTDGRFRNGEAKALLPVLTVANQYPAIFQSLANDDQGNDPNTFEVALLQDRLQRIAAIQPLMEAVAERSQELADTVMYIGGMTKPVMQAAYQLVKPQAKHNPKIQTVVAPTIDYYAAMGKAAAATRKREKQAASAAASGPSSGSGKA